MFSPKALFFILCSINYVFYGAAQRINGSLYIPGVPSVGGLEPGEIVVAELIGTDGETSSFVLLDSIPTIVSGSTSRTTATFTLVSEPTGILLTADVDRKLGANDVEEDIQTQCFIDGTGDSICQDVMIDIVNHEKTVTVTSLFSETTSLVPVIAVGFGSTSSAPTTAAAPSNVSSVAMLPVSGSVTNSTSTTPTLTPSVPSPTPTTSDDGLVTTITITSSSSASPTGDSPMPNLASKVFLEPLLSATFAVLIVMCCFL